MVQMVNDQAQLLLIAMNSSNKEHNNKKVSPSSTVVSEWSDEEQRNITLLSVTLTQIFND